MSTYLVLICPLLFSHMQGFFFPRLFWGWPSNVDYNGRACEVLVTQRFLKFFLKGTHGALVRGGWRRVFFWGFCVNKGYDDGMSFNKELQKFNIPYYSLFKQLKKEIYMCYYVTQIWKGRKNTQTTLEGKSHQRNKNCFL